MAKTPGWVVLLETADVRRILDRPISPKGGTFAVTFVDGKATVVNTDIIVLSKAEHGKLMEAARDFNRRYEMNPDGGDVCNICGRAPGNPFRVYDERGKVVNGCVAEAHTGHLVTPSESARWHNRAEAKKVRAALAKMQKGR